jgi:hypothetical protein
MNESRADMKQRWPPNARRSIRQRRGGLGGMLGKLTKGADISSGVSGIMSEARPTDPLADQSNIENSGQNNVKISFYNDFRQIISSYICSFNTKQSRHWTKSSKLTKKTWKVK